jgi:hypothetical protein
MYSPNLVQGEFSLLTCAALLALLLEFALVLDNLLAPAAYGQSRAWW